MEMNFTGQRALVTGAGKGIGRSTAKMLAKCGAEVIALSRTQGDLDTLKKEVPSIETVCTDLEDTAAAIKTVEGLGDIHLLVNNAAVTILAPFEDVKLEDFDKLFSVNVKAPIFISQVFWFKSFKFLDGPEWKTFLVMIVAKKMISRGNGGAIVNVSSQASKRALRDHTLYCSSKAALDMLTQIMALELGPYKIRVNSVNPTVVMTDMGRLGWSDPAKAKPMLNRIPLGRFADEEDVVHAIVYLLSDKANMIHGAILPVDGGFLTS